MFDVEDRTFLKDLKVGDKVALAHSHSWSGDRYTVEVVESLTRTQVRLVGYPKQAWDRDTGRQKGRRDSWSFPPHLVKLTQEIVNDIRERNALRLVERVKWSEMPVTVIAQVAAIVREHEKSKVKDSL